MKTLHAAKFLVTGPLILGLLFVINLLTSPHHWWIQWPALGIGIAWVISLMRVIWAVILVGGLAVLWNRLGPSAIRNLRSANVLDRLSTRL